MIYIQILNTLFILYLCYYSIIMARTALKAKQSKMYEKRFTQEKPLSHPTKYYNRCRLCGRVKSYVRDFGICRVCLRKYAREWLIMWLKKASW